MKQSPAAVRDPSGARRLIVEVGGFEGPLDLLLHLIQKHEIDIFELPIAFITEEYLRYIEAMVEVELAIAGEYLVMAATLLHIKSRMLLPKPEVDESLDDEPSEDPRTALVRRLLEYQRYKGAAEQLAARHLVGRDVFLRPSRAEIYRARVGPAALAPLDLYRLLDAFRHAMRERPAEAVHDVTPERLTMRETAGKIADYLSTTPRATLLELIYLIDDEPERAEIVVTFLAVLEMAKLRMVRLFQAKLTTKDLIVERAVVTTEELEQRLVGVDDA